MVPLSLWDTLTSNTKLWSAFTSENLKFSLVQAYRGCTVTFALEIPGPSKTSGQHLNMEPDTDASSSCRMYKNVHVINDRSQLAEPNRGSINANELPTPSNLIDVD